MKKPFSILLEDLYDKKGKIRDFHNIYVCPLLAAVKRQYPELNIDAVGISKVIDMTNFKIYTIDDKFGSTEYCKLAEGKEFHTFINI